MEKRAPLKPLAGNNVFKDQFRHNITCPKSHFLGLILNKTRPKKSNLVNTRGTQYMFVTIQLARPSAMPDSIVS